MSSSVRESPKEFIVSYLT